MSDKLVMARLFKESLALRFGIDRDGFVGQVLDHFAPDNAVILDSIDP